MNETRPPSPTSNTSRWCFLGRRTPRGEIVYFTQILVIYSVIVVSLFNLTRGHEPSSLWISLLSSCLGYVLPNPNLKTHDG